MSWMIYTTSPLFWFVFVFGSIIGSFLNVVILRVPEKTFFKHTRSVCPACNALIPAWLNIPIFSWFLLRGRARCCGAMLSPQYPIVEFLTGLIFLICYVQHPFFGWTLGPISWNVDEAIRFSHAAIFVSLMLVCSVIDIRLMIIPDEISLSMLALTPVVAWIHPDLDMASALIGATAGAGFLYFIAWLYWLIRKQYGMGFGDVKLLGAIGGWLGYQAIFSTLFLGSMIGSIIGIAVLLVSRRFSWQARIPFGPFLAAGAVLHLWFGAEIFNVLAGG